jgi:DNA repair photolyase
VISDPWPHLVSSTKKDLHGWAQGKRDCTAERLLINPYNGCSHDCGFCYAHALPGRFATFVQHGVITVWDDFAGQVGKQLDSLLVASCGYLSPVTDPFQPVERRYGQSVAIIREFVRRGLPVEFVTKAEVPDEALAAMQGHTHCFGQVSLLTLDEKLHRALVPGGPGPGVLLGNLRRMRQAGVYAVARIDPVVPGLTDDPDQLRRLVGAVREAGANHIVASCMDLPLTSRKRTLERLALVMPGPDRAAFTRRLEGLYRERIGSSQHAAEGYRRDLFGFLRGAATEAGLTFALCMEYVAPPTPWGGGGGLPVGLNREFATTRNCEGLDVPLYVRGGPDEPFRPVPGCDGACLYCDRERAAETCGLPELAGGGAWELADYRRWGRVRAGLGAGVT